MTREDPAMDVAGNNYDLVLACNPRALFNRPLYDGIVGLAEQSDFKIYSPHSEKDAAEGIRFTIDQAIPSCKGVIFHIDRQSGREISDMYDEMTKHQRPHLLMLSNELVLNPQLRGLRSYLSGGPGYVGDLVYGTNSHAINLLEQKLPDLLDIARGDVA